MEKLYLALVDTPGFFASVIRRVIGIDYIHVVLSMDEELNEAYSVGRRNPAVPILAGFEKEDAQKIEQVFPTAKYKVMSIELYMFFLCGRHFGKKWDGAFWKAFFTGDAKGFL